VKALIIDFSRVLIFAKDPGVESLNRYHREHVGTPGYDFYEHFDLNRELLEFLAGLKDRVPMYIFTDGKLHVLPEVAMYLRDTFRGAKTVESMGVSKKDPEVYRKFVAGLGLAPGEVVFVDDKMAHVAAAQAAGLRGVQYRDNAQVMQELAEAFGLHSHRISEF
jgi:HAD superfamily hydrolase (TIGR01509 family)